MLRSIKLVREASTRSVLRLRSQHDLKCGPRAPLANRPLGQADLDLLPRLCDVSRRWTVCCADFVSVYRVFITAISIFILDRVVERGEVAKRHRRSAIHPGLTGALFAADHVSVEGWSSGFCRLSRHGHDERDHGVRTGRRVIDVVLQLQRSGCVPGARHPGI